MGIEAEDKTKAYKLLKTDIVPSTVCTVEVNLLQSNSLEY